MPIVGASDNVVAMLQRKGVPLTNENYQRMSNALRIGGNTGAPVTPRQARAAKSYMPERGEVGASGDNEAIEAVPDNEAVEIEANNDGLPIDDAYLRDMNEVRSMQPMQTKQAPTNIDAIDGVEDETSAIPQQQPGMIDGLMQLVGPAAAAIAGMYGLNRMKTNNASGLTPTKALPAPNEMKMLPAPAKQLPSNAPVAKTVDQQALEGKQTNAKGFDVTKTKKPKAKTEKTEAKTKPAATNDNEAKAKSKQQVTKSLANRNAERHRSSLTSTAKTAARRL